MKNLLFRDFEKKNQINFLIKIKNALLLISLYNYIKIINEKIYFDYLKSFVKNNFDNLIIDFIKFYDEQIVYVYDNNNYVVAKYVLIDVQKFGFILTKKFIENFRSNSKKLF